MPEKPDLRPERSDFRSERADVRPERADFRHESEDFRPEREDFRPEREDFRPESKALRACPCEGRGTALGPSSKAGFALKPAPVFAFFLFIVICFFFLKKFMTDFF